MIQSPIFYLFKELKITAATVIVVVALFLLSLRVITPYIPKALPGLKYWVEYQIKTPVSIDELKVVWIGSKPAIRFEGLTILDETREHSIIESNTVDILLSPLDSLINGRFIIDAIVIDHASLRIEADTVSKISTDDTDSNEIEYLALIEQANTPVLQFGTAWVELIRGMPIERVIIKNSDIHFREKSGHSWPLTDVTAAVTRSSESVKLRAVATLLGGEPAEFYIGADIEDAFSAPTGQIVIRGKNFDLERVESWFETGIAKATHGTVGLTLWTGLSEGYWDDIKIELVGKDVIFASVDSEEIDRFDSVTGQLLWKKGRNKHEWKLLGREFSISHHDIPNWIPTQFSLLQYGTAGEPRFDFTAQQLQLDTWMPFLIRTNWLPASVHKTLSQYRPAGVVDYLNIGLTNLTNDVPRFNIQFEGDRLALTQPDINYRFENVNIRVDMDNTSGSMEVLSPDIRYFPATQPESVLTLDKWQTQINWFELEEGWRVQLPWLFSMVGEGSLEASAGFTVNRAGLVEDASLLMFVDKLDGSEVLKRFPIGMSNTNFRDWLSAAQIEGGINNLVFLYRGDLKGFDNHEDVMRMTSDMENLGLYFQPEWPRIKKVEANLNIKDLTLDVDVYSGEFGDHFDLSGKAVIPNVDAKDAFIVADAHVIGDLKNVGLSLTHSPLADKVDDILDSIVPEGKLDLELTVNASFDSDGPVTLRALLDLDDASIRIPSLKNMQLTQLSGDVAFSDTNLRSSNLTGKLGSNEFNSTVEMTFSGPNPYLDFKAESWLDSDEMEQWFGHPLPLAGSTPFEVAVQMPLNKEMKEGQVGRILFQSHMTGMGIDLPAPFAKSIDDTRLLQLTTQIQSADMIGLTARLDGVASFAGRLSNTQNGWEPVGAHLHFSADEMATFPQERQLLIDGYLPYLSAEQWSNVWDEYSSYIKSDPKASNSPGLEPTVSLDISLLDLWGIPVQELSTKATPITDGWKIEANAPVIEGTMLIPEQIYDAPIILDLVRLKLPEKVKRSDKDADADDASSEQPLIPVDMRLPTIQASIAQLYWRDLEINSFTGAFNAMKTGYDYQIAAQSKPLSFDLQGQWGGLVPQEPMSVTGFIETRNFGDLLNRIHTYSAIKDASGRVEVDLAWLGGVTDPQLPTFSGTVESALRSGRVLGVEPGLGRILSLLSLSNIQRRLTLDFSDLTKEGFAFDKIDASIVCDKGYASTDNFALRGPIANLDFQGKIDLHDDHQINAQLELSPNLEGSLPIAATIASGNPAIGAFLWAFDKVVGNEINEIARYRYAITGNWLEPQIEELEIIKEKSTEAK